jgi:hypothetical protein
MRLHLLSDAVSSLVFNDTVKRGIAVNLSVANRVISVKKYIILAHIAYAFLHLLLY